MSDEGKGRPRKFFEFMKLAVQEYLNDRGSDKAGSLAFFAAFSVAPLLVIAIAMAGFFFGEAAVRGELASQIEAAVGPEPAEMIQAMIQQAAEVGTGVIATIIGIGALLWGGVRLFLCVQRNLDAIWGIEPDDLGWKESAWDKIRSALFIVGAGAFLLALLLISMVISVVTSVLEEIMPVQPWLVELLNLSLIFALLMGVFGVLFRVLPRANPRWKDVWVGAAVTAALFVLGRWVVGYYLSETTAASIFGAAGALAVVLLWMYYMAQIFFFGAEITKVYAMEVGDFDPDKVRREQQADGYEIATPDDAMPQPT